MFLLLSKFRLCKTDSCARKWRFSELSGSQVIWRQTKARGARPRRAGACAWDPALKAPAWPGTHRCRAAGTARTPRSGPWRVTAPLRLRLTGPLRSCAPPSARRRRRPPARSSRPAPACPAPSPRERAGRPALAAADPAQRMPVIPLCRLAGVRGHREKRGGRGRPGAEEWGEQDTGMLVWGVWGGGVAGLAAPRGAGCLYPLGQKGYQNTPFNCQGSMSNDPLGLRRRKKKTLKYFVTGT